MFLDAENDEFHALEQSTYDFFIKNYNQQSPYLFKTYQMYRRDSLKHLVSDMNTYEHLGIKLVRGAYMHQDCGRGVLFANKQETDTAYDKAVRVVMHNMIDRRAGSIKLLIATHNNHSINKALHLVNKFNLRQDVSFGQLLGMNETAGKMLSLHHGISVYKYVPYGSIIELAPYLARRLVENSSILQHCIL